MAVVPQSATGVAHPLDPLSLEEISRATAAVRDRPELSQRLRFATVTLHEPPKDVILGFKPGNRVERQAFVVVLDNASEKTYEAVVSLDSNTVASFRHVPDVQPSMLVEEFMACEA